MLAQNMNHMLAKSPTLLCALVFRIKNNNDNNNNKSPRMPPTIESCILQAFIKDGISLLILFFFFLVLFSLSNSSSETAFLE